MNADLLAAKQLADVKAVLLVGKPVITPALAARAAPDKAKLVDAFYGAYTNPGATGSALRPVPDAAATNRLIAALSTANASRWSWMGGVAFGGHEDGQVVVVLPTGERRRVPRAHFDGPDIQGRGRMLVDRENSESQPGWYFANGEDQLSAAKEPHLRLYWATTPEGSIPLVSAVTTRFNRNRIPFSMKVARDPSGYHRCDAGVVYVPTYAWPRANQIVMEIYEDVRPYLRVESTRFAKPLAPGVGLAEDPGGGESFGQARCTLLADLTVRWTPKVADYDELERRVIQSLPQAGYKLGRLHLNPTTQGDFDTTATASMEVRA